MSINGDEFQRAPIYSDYPHWLRRVDVAIGHHLLQVEQAESRGEAVLYRFESTRYANRATPSPDSSAVSSESEEATAPLEFPAVAGDCRWELSSHQNSWEGVVDEMIKDPVLDGEVQTARLEEIQGYTIAVEASWYLQNLLDASQEPLLSALGGLPFALKGEIEEDLADWKKCGVTPIFVFDGIYIVGQEEMCLRAAKSATRKSDAAWELYRIAKTPEQINNAVTAFGNLGAIQPKELYRFFQAILFENDVYFETASHSACAYMAYLDKHPIRKDGQQAFEAIMGSTELLLYDIDHSIVTKIDFETGTYSAIVKTSLPQKLNVSEETLSNALLMTGNSFLPTFPALKDRELIKQQPFSVTDAVNMYRAANKSMSTLCETWSEILDKQEPGWPDKYKKAKMAIKHNIHAVDKEPGVDGSGAQVRPTNVEQLTGDHLAYLGLTLPQESYHYLIHGNIGRNVLNWITYLKITVFPPLAGGDVEEYRRLVTQELVPIQAQTIALYTSKIHRTFQHQDFKIQFWFDNNATVVIKPYTVEPSPEKLTSTWRVKDHLYSSQKAPTSSKPGSLAFALLSLQNTDFAASTKRDSSDIQILQTEAEILSNAMWWLLHLRGYVNNEHRLTKWGEALTTTLNHLKSVDGALVDQLEEAVFLAFELLQLNHLNVQNRREEWIGAPQQGDDDDKNHCLLIARCASLVKLRHNEKGYTGPLSKNLLAYHSIVSAVRQTDRDLIEAIALSICTFGHMDRRNTRDDESTQVRKRNNRDWISLGFSLPFGKDIDIGLGIAVKTYLDSYARPGSTTEEKVNTMANYVVEQLPHSVDFHGDLEITYNFFNALLAGIKTLSRDIPADDLAIWEGAATYFSERR